MTAASDPGRPWTWPVRPAWLALLALGLALRLAYLGLPLRYDEAMTFLGLVDRPLLAVLADYSPNNHLLHTVLAKLCVGLLGEEEWALRLPALLAGVLVVPSLAWVAGRVFGLVEGFAVAGLAAATAWLVSYAVDARGYSLALLAQIGRAHV
jgi:predicted membrane-bound mannosyltransferase